MDYGSNGGYFFSGKEFGMKVCPVREIDPDLGMGIDLGIDDHTMEVDSEQLCLTDMTKKKP